MIKDTKILYNINELDNLNICCGYYQDNDKIYYFDDFSKVNKQHYNNIFYFIAESKNKNTPRFNYSLNETLFIEHTELLYNATLYRKEEYHQIGIMNL